ncbi:MAG: hypothetical protein JNM10_18335 [Planctomycetia bacterium]|nr:hypothetical protein [Planctomycetia bacterium]
MSSRKSFATSVLAFVLGGALGFGLRGPRPASIEPEDAPTPHAPGAAAGPAAPRAVAPGEPPPLAANAGVDVAALRDELRRVTADLEALRAARRADDAGAPLPALIDRVAALRRDVGARLLAVPPAVSARYREVLKDERAGLCRILERGRFEHVVEARGGGAYWSFARRSNSYDEEPDVELQQGHYSTSFYGGTDGWILDLGPGRLERWTFAAAEPPPPSLSEADAAKWRVLWRPAHTTRDGYDASIGTAAREAGLTDRAEAKDGHLYALRAIMPGEHDHLVLFERADDDEFGHTLAFHVLQAWPVPDRRQR